MKSLLLALVFILLSATSGFATGCDKAGPILDIAYCSQYSTAGAPPPPPLPNPNLLSCSGNIGGSTWVGTGGASYATATQALTLPASSTWLQNISAKVQPNKTYTLSALLTAGASPIRLQNFDGVTHSMSGDLSANVTIPISYTFTTGPSISGNYAAGFGTDVANNGAVYTLVHAKLEVGSFVTAYGTDTICPQPNSRLWAFFDNVGSDTTAWTQMNAIAWGQPIDGLHGQTDFGDSFWFGDGFAWSPTPHRLSMSDQWGSNGIINTCFDMGAAARGDFDTLWRGWLTQHAGSPPKIVRMWQEINGNFGFGWQANCTGTTSVDGTPNGSVWPVLTIQHAYQHMATQIRAVFPQALIEFNCNGGVQSPPGPGDGSCVDLYPGDQYADVIGIDMYQKFTTFAAYKNGSGVTMDGLSAFARAHGKYFAVSETAAHNCDGTWMTNLANYFDGLGSTGLYLSYFDQGLGNNGDNVLFRTTGTDSCPASTLQAAFKATSFGQKSYFGPLGP